MVRKRRRLQQQEPIVSLPFGKNFDNENDRSAAKGAAAAKAAAAKAEVSEQVSEAVAEAACAIQGRGRRRRNGCTPAPTASPTDASATIASYVASDPELSILAQALEASSLDSFLDQDDIEATLFAPVDSAFEDVLDVGYVERLLHSLAFRLHLTDLLSYHMYMEAPVRSSELQDEPLIMANGEQITVDADEGGPIALSGAEFDGSIVVGADAVVANGVVHKVTNTVFLPSFYGMDFFDFLSNDSRFTIFTNLLARAGLEETLRTGYFTVLAPPDSVWEGNSKLLAFLQDEENASDLDTVLKYHLLLQVLPSTELIAEGDAWYTTAAASISEGVSVDFSTGIVFASRAQALTLDVLVRNGIVHIIDAVLLPSEISV